MAKMQHTILVALVATAAHMVMVPPAAAATTHVVGGSIGWDVPPNMTFYEEWAKPITFRVGDKLYFPYRMPFHNVLEVSKEDFPKCKQNNVIRMHYKGPLEIVLDKPGTRYFYSGIGLQCEVGQKLAITVVEEGKSPSRP